MSVIKNIGIVTGTRAEYGLLRPLITGLENTNQYTVNLVVTGMHLSPEFGNTVEEIEQNGHAVAARIEMLLSSDTAAGITKSIGLGVVSFADYFQKADINLLIVLGDRTEILAACVAALVFGIPIAHISGGETTEGAYDEAIRHCITKMSYIHFAATDLYANRIIQLGESPDRVFNVGAIGIDSIRSLELLSRAEFEESIGMKLGEKNLLVTFHPVTLENGTSSVQFQQLLDSLDTLADTKFIFTRPNSDKGGRIISELIDGFVAKNSGRAVAFASLGQKRYLSALSLVDAVVGNSSSGIVEVPYFGIPTINIGDRQKGRLMPGSVICCEPVKEDITAALQLAYDDEFRKKIKEVATPYGDGKTSKRIIEILQGLSIESVKKQFYDLPFKLEVDNV